jgi:hypothetical protein
MSFVDPGPSVPEVAMEEYFDAPDHQEVEWREERVTPKIKGKEKAVLPGNDSAIDIPCDCNEVDWTKYEPPTGLKHMPNVELETIIQVIQESIDRVKSRIIEEEERRRAEAEAQALRQEREAQLESEKGKEPGVPEISLTGNEEQQEEATAAPVPTKTPYGYAMSKKTLRRDPNGLLTSPPITKPKKRSLFGLLKRLNQSYEKGETSAAGSTRHRRSTSSGDFDLDTQAGRRRFVIDAIKKVTANSSIGPVSPATSKKEEDSMV